MMVFFENIGFRKTDESVAGTVLFWYPRLKSWVSQKFQCACTDVVNRFSEHRLNYFLLTILSLLFPLVLLATAAKAEEGTRESPADTVHYAAESIDCRFEQDTTIVLVGSAKVVYQYMELQAGKITYDP